MVDAHLKEIIKPYAVTAKVTQQDKRSHFLTIDSLKEKRAPIIVHYVDGRIYAVRFLNNEFFEISDEQLYDVIVSLLSGNYEVKRSSLRRKPYIVISKSDSTTRILPERTYPSSSIKNEYELIPSPFPRNN